MANLNTLKPIRTKNEARERGRNGGIASGKARREKKAFAALLLAILDTPMQELKNVCPRLAIVKGMILKAASGNIPAAAWVRDTAGEKPVAHTRNKKRDTVKVVLFGE